MSILVVLVLLVLLVLLKRGDCEIDKVVGPDG